ncbi:bromodomain-containing protein 8-like [Ornithodoros turicata]|uniref:bromodomain-containing protein 8-like n=1 Tax=Ornithodoros turicata TaxID=34597 RepID=UPI003139F886
MACSSKYRLKQTPTDVWSTRERLCLASSVLRSGDQNWMSVSRAIRPFGENNRPNDWFSQKNCALQYFDLLEKVESPKRKRGERGEIDTPGALIIRKLTIERIEELKKVIQDEQQRHKRYRRELDLLKAGHLDEKLEEVWKQVQDEMRAKEIAEIEFQKWVKDREIQLAAIRAARATGSKIKKARGTHEVRRSSSQSEHSEPDSVADSPLSVEVEDVSSPLPTSVHRSDGDVMSTPQRSHPSPTLVTVTPLTPPAASTSLLTSLLKSPTPASPVSSSSGLCSLTSSPVHQPKEGSIPTTLQGSPRASLPPSFFNPMAARQLATGAVSPGVSNTSGQHHISPTHGESPLHGSRSPGGALLSPHSATSSAPTLSKLLELPPSTPGGRLPSLPFFTSQASSLPPTVTQVTVPAPVEIPTTQSTDTTDASSSNVEIPTEKEEEIMLTEKPDVPFPSTDVVEEIPVPEAEPAPPTPEATELMEEPSEEPIPIENEVKIDVKEEEIEVEEDQIVSSTEAESIVEAVASEEMVVEETVIEDSLSSGVNIETEDDKVSVKSETLDLEKGVSVDAVDIADDRSAEETLTKDIVCPDSKPYVEEDTEEKDDAEEQQTADESEKEGKDTGRSEDNDDEPSSPSSPKKKANLKFGMLRRRNPLRLVEEEEEDRDSKDASMPETPSSASPAAETSSNVDEPASEDADDEKLKDDKSSVEDVKTPETPAVDTKDDTSQHADSGGEEVANELSKHFAGTSMSDSVPNSPASMLHSDDPESLRDYKLWKKAIMLVWRAAATHKYANVFLHPVTDEMAPGYHSIVYRPMDLLTIKKNIESGYIKTTLEFQRDIMLMFQNAIMYNSSDHDVFHMAIEMQKEVMGHIQDFLATQLMVRTTETKTLRGRERDVREKKPETPKEEKEDEKKKKPTPGAPTEEPQAKKRRTRTNE